MNTKEIADFLSKIEPTSRDALKDKFRWFLPEDSKWWHTVSRDNYMYPYAKLFATLNPGRYLVVGVLAATSESLALQMFKPERLKTFVVCDIDLVEMNCKRDTGAAAYKNICGTDYGNFQGEFVYIRADSMRTDLFTRLGKFDLIFLDGCHAKMAIMSDLNKSKDLLSPGGTILVHDIDMGEGQYVGSGYFEWLEKNKDMVHDEVHDPVFFNGMGIIQKKL